MKNIVFALITICITAVNVNSAEIDVATKAESVTIYHSGALVTRTSSVELKEGMNELVFKNLSSKIVLSSLKVSNKEITILNKSIIRKLTKEEYSQLLDKKEAITKQITLIEAKYNENGFVAKVEDLEKMTAFYSEKIMQAKRDLREVEKKIEDAKKLEDIELKNDNAAILKLVVSIDGRLKEPLKIQYVCGGIGWSPAYEVTASSSADKTIEIKYLAKTMSQTGEDWDNVHINLSSSFPLESPTDLPKAKTLWVLDGRSYNYKGQYANAPIAAQQATEQQQIEQLEGVEYEETNIPSFLKLRVLKEKYSIKSNSTVFTFPVQTVKLPVNFYYFGYPGIEPEVFLIAQLTGWDTLGFIDGIASMTYNGNNIGKSLIKFSESNDTLLLPIGKDNSVFLKRTEIADKKYFKITSIGKKRETTYAYKYELKNNNTFPVRFELVDQIPISQTKLAEVEMKNVSDGKISHETGEVTWQLDIKPQQRIEKELIYKIEMDSDYNYLKDQPARQYKSSMNAKFL